MEVDGVVAAVAWAVTVWKVPAVWRNRARDERVLRVWAFALFFALGLTFEVDAVYFAVDAFAGVNNLAWLAIYVCVALGFYFFATTCFITMKVPPPRWLRPYLLVTLGLFAVIFPIGVAGGPEWPAHDIPRGLFDLAFMETLYIFAGVLCLMPALSFIRFIQSEEILPTRIRTGMTLLAVTLVFILLVVKVVVVLTGFLDPASPLVPFLATLSKALLGAAGLIWGLTFASQRFYLALARPFTFLQNVLTLRDLRRLQARLNRLCPPVAPDPAGWWGRLRNLDFHIYRTVIGILDGRKTLADYLEIPEPEGVGVVDLSAGLPARNAQAGLPSHRQAYSLPAARRSRHGAQAGRLQPQALSRLDGSSSSGPYREIVFSESSGVLPRSDSSPDWDAGAKAEAVRLHRALQAVPESRDFEDLVTAYRDVGRRLE